MKTYYAAICTNEQIQSFRDDDRVVLLKEIEKRMGVNPKLEYRVDEILISDAEFKEMTGS